MAIPKDHQQLMPYLLLKDAAKFIDFAQCVFGAKETFKAMHSESRIMQAEIVIGSSTIMLADSTETYRPRPAGMFV